MRALAPVAAGAGIPRRHRCGAAGGGLPGAGGAIGFTLVLILFAGVRERLETCDIPAPFKGTSIAMITAGLMSLAFMGFSGLVK